jgi:hypothetical protein
LPLGVHVRLDVHAGDPTHIGPQPSTACRDARGELMKLPARPLGVMSPSALADLGARAGPDCERQLAVETIATALGDRSNPARSRSRSILGMHPPRHQRGPPGTPPTVLVHEPPTRCITISDLAPARWTHTTTHRTGQGPGPCSHSLHSGVRLPLPLPTRPFQQHHSREHP